MFSNQNTKRESEYWVRSGLQPVSYLKPSPLLAYEQNKIKTHQYTCSNSYRCNIHDKQRGIGQAALKSGCSGDTNGLPVVTSSSFALPATAAISLSLHRRQLSQIQHSTFISTSLGEYVSRQIKRINNALPEIKFYSGGPSGYLKGYRRRDRSRSWENIENNLLFDWKLAKKCVKCRCAGAFPLAS